MASKARYLVILIFIIVVIGAMFFIYSTIDSEEEIVYFDGTPPWHEKALCYVRGGRVEVLSDISALEKDCLGSENQLQKDCISEEVFSCHFR